MPIRADRPILPLCGTGGFLGFQWVGEHGLYERDPEWIEVGKWIIERFYRNAEIPQAGGDGWLSARRIAMGFRWRAEMLLDLHPQTPCPALRLNGEEEGNYLISMRFQAGDPSFPGRDRASIATVTEQTGLYYYARAVLLDKVTITNQTQKSVACLLEGIGASPLLVYMNSSYLGTDDLGEALLEQRGRWGEGVHELQPGAV